ncbi:MAG: hypothetical protein ACREHD_02035, partial [Pirellulales bacterium]
MVSVIRPRGGWGKARPHWIPPLHGDGQLYSLHGALPRRPQNNHMKITEIRTIALRGATHDHGWPGGTDPN